METMVLVPAYNEQESIQGVIEEIRRTLIDSRIVVVDDGSSDRTAVILEGISGITVIHHPFNVGIGGTIWTGFHYFLRSPYGAVLRIDADGQHPPDEGRKVLAALIEEKADMSIGSRYLQKKGFQSTFSRRAGIKLLDFMTSVFLRRRITDNTSGLRAYTRRAVEALVDDFPFDYPEPIEAYLLAKKKLKIVEVPVTMRERRRGVSSIKTLDSYYYLIKVLLTILVKYAIGGAK
jgi:hypothetical protein